MSQLMKRGRVQLQLPLELVSVQPHPLEHVRSEAIEVLADLLLEAMGPEKHLRHRRRCLDTRPLKLRERHTFTRSRRTRVEQFRRGKANGYPNGPKFR